MGLQEEEGEEGGDGVFFEMVEVRLFFEGFFLVVFSERYGFADEDVTGWVMGEIVKEVVLLVVSLIGRFF